MKQNKTIEQQYQKMTQIEHILKRPDTYIGSIQKQNEQMFIFENGKIVLSQVEYVPGFYKIFDEILVNAADNYSRDMQMNYIKVEIGEEMISVRNDGRPIPVQIHQEHQCYVPEMIFGMLLTGSNYDDDEKRVVGGRNGYGAKLTNIYSKEFVVEVCDGVSYFKMVWSNNMSNKTGAHIEKCAKSPFVQISYKPDLNKFGMKTISEMKGILSKRVYDIAGIYSKLKVHLNNEMIKVNSFLKYVDLYLDEGAIKVYDPKMKTDRWEVVCTYSNTQFTQVSFVNSIHTYKGGTHVNYCTDKIIADILEEVGKQKKYKGVDVQKQMVKANLWIFINCQIDNPSFDSQTKEFLTTRVSDFGGGTQDKFVVSEAFIKAFMKTDIIEIIFQQAKAKQNAKLGRALKGNKTAKLHGIEKLDDANDAGKKNSELCTLILTEGDSAKSLAMSGLDVVGRDRYGVFPLRGKLLNVREAPHAQLMKNEEIQNIIKILGLQLDKTYDDVKQLRYGSLMIMTDQDSDGSHIKGLIINFILHFWPSLFKLKGFLKEFVTPLIKASKGNQRFSFFTVQDFKIFADQTDLTGWKIKYYKGLGTSDDEEAQEYFKNLRHHQINFKYVGEEDVDAIDLCFSRKRINDRKIWLSNYNHNSFVDHTQKELQYKDFVNKEMIHFSMSDNIRSIPQLMDGFKPGQRKVLFSCFKRNLKQELKVVQLGGYIAEHSAYHHGDISLQMTIVAMAQNFIGSNNINLLLPKGQFGSRSMGGKDHASARYISTQLSKVTRYIFPEQDDHSLNYMEDDGEMVEPEYYVPIIPMSLVNGAEGIGTGWSTFIDCYNPRDLVEQIKRKIRGEPLVKLKPWYKFFDGTIEEDAKNGYYIKGLVELDLENDIAVIKELPVGKWTKNYKDWLDKQMQSDDPKIIDMNEYHTKHKIHFELQLQQGYASQIKDPLDEFNLVSTSQTTNMVLFDSKLAIKKYETVNSIIDEFYEVRLQFYDKRKQYLISKLQREVEIIEQKVKFINMVIKDEIKLRNVKQFEVVAQLEKKGFIKFSDLTQVKSTKLKAFGDKKAKKEAESDDETEGEEEEKKKQESKKAKDGSVIKEYNYLLSLPLYSLTWEKVDKLNNDSEIKHQEMRQLSSLPPHMMWIQDLDKFLQVLDEIEEQELAIINKGEKRPKQVKDQKKKPKKQVEVDSDDNFQPQKEQKEQKEKEKRARQQKQTKEENGLAKIKRRQSNGSLEQNQQKLNFTQKEKQVELQSEYFIKGPQTKNRKVVDDD